MSVCAALGFMTAAPPMNLLKQGDYEAVIPMDFKPNPAKVPKVIPSADYPYKDDRNALQKLGFEAASDAMDDDGNEEDEADADEADEDEADADEADEDEDEDSTDVDENEGNQVGNFEAVAPMDFKKNTLDTKKKLIKKLKAIIKKTPNESDALKAIKEVIDLASDTTNTPAKIIKKTIKKSTKPKKTKKNKKTKETDASK
jgi:hypothetical protein